jgi:prepilin-type N-terminal cleavage/methylation domain-containing protein
LEGGGEGAVADGSVSNIREGGEDGEDDDDDEGFTIVELLIVVVVIAILAAITIVSYNGITNRANAFPAIFHKGFIALHDQIRAKLIHTMPCWATTVQLI